MLDAIYANVAAARLELSEIRNPPMQVRDALKRLSDVVELINKKDTMEDGFYWFDAERSSRRSIGQHINGRWYLVAEEGSFTLEEINRRGWDLSERIEGQDKE